MAGRRRGAPSAVQDGRPARMMVLFFTSTRFSCVMVARRRVSVRWGMGVKVSVENFVVFRVLLGWVGSTRRLGGTVMEVKSVRYRKNIGKILMIQCSFGAGVWPATAAQAACDQQAAAASLSKCPEQVRLPSFSSSPELPRFLHVFEIKWVSLQHGGEGFCQGFGEFALTSHRVVGPWQHRRAETGACSACRCCGSCRTKPFGCTSGHTHAPADSSGSYRCCRTSGGASTAESTDAALAAPRACLPHQVAGSTRVAAAAWWLPALEGSHSARGKG